MHQPANYLLLMIKCVCLSWSFNIDLRNPEFYTEGNFPSKDVLPVQSPQNKGILVTVPLYVNGSGAVYRHEQLYNNSLFTPKVITLGEKGEPIRHVVFLGLPRAKPSTKTRVCSPVAVAECYENPYMKKVCYEIQGPPQELFSFTPHFQECPKKTVNLVFLFDGSTSMSENDFEKNKYFIEDIMTTFKNSSFKFAAVQFATERRIVFTFNDYTNGTVSGFLKKEKQMKGLTNIYGAMNFTLETHFENLANGASPEATKVLVVITDGDPSDRDRGTIQTYDSKNIIRFVIGVKDADPDRLKSLASEPFEKRLFYIDSYNGLRGIFEKIKTNILETESALVADLRGLKGVFTKDTLLLSSDQEIERLKEDSYTGYSVSVGERNNTTLCFSGTQEDNHTGQVVLFQPTRVRWTPVQKITGEQHGSYFGAELCSVDVDSDGSTDFLLVGAPLFYQPHENGEGKIYIYRLTDELKLIRLFNVTAQVMGRFGTTIASVADLNGDGLRDVAVGAPLENQNRGAVYLFLGDRRRGIRSTYSQRIMGEEVSSELRFFGQSIDGSLDLGEDGLPDLLVGSQGLAVVLRSKLIFNVMAHLSFEPKEISIKNISNKDEFLPLVTLKICFNMTEATKSSTGAVKPGLKISYTLDVDSMRQTYRGFFNSTTKQRNLTETHELTHNENCFSRSVYIPKCISDILSPISIKMKFSQVDSERAHAILNTDSEKETSVEVPFERRFKDACTAEIEVDFNFTTKTLLMADNNDFNVSLSLFNRGEDSYNTSLTIHHSPGLSFSRMSLAQDSKSRPIYTCNNHEDRTTCGISLPVYRSGSEATFISVFRVRKEYDWKHSLSVTITGNSDNQNSTRGSLTKTIPVKFPIKMALEETINYLNFSAEDSGPKRLLMKFKVNNHGRRAFPVNVTLFFPTKLEHNFEMNNYQVFVEQNKTKCELAKNKLTTESAYCTAERECRFIVCDTFILNNASAVEFELSGEVQQFKQDPLVYTNKLQEIKAFLRVTFDKQKYVLDSATEKVDYVQATSTSVIHFIKEKDNSSETISENSENETSTQVLQTDNIINQFEINIKYSTGEGNTDSLNFTTENSGPKRLVTKYKVNNHGWRAFPVNVTLFFPTKLEHNFEINNYQVFVEQNTTHCNETHTAQALKPEYCTAERECKFIACDTFILNNASAVEFELSGQVQFKDISQHNVPLLRRYTGYKARIIFKSFLHATNVLDSDNRKSEILIELNILPDKMLIIVTGAGAGLSLILVFTIIAYKVRCSKRKMQYMVEEQMRKQLEKPPAVKVKAVIMELKEDKTFLITDRDLLTNCGLTNSKYIY